MLQYPEIRSGNASANNQLIYNNQGLLLTGLKANEQSFQINVTANIGSGRFIFDGVQPITAYTSFDLVPYTTYQFYIDGFGLNSTTQDLTIGYGTGGTPTELTAQTVHIGNPGQGLGTAKGNFASRACVLFRVDNTVLSLLQSGNELYLYNPRVPSTTSWYIKANVAIDNQTSISYYGNTQPIVGNTKTTGTAEVIGNLLVTGGERQGDANNVISGTGPHAEGQLTQATGNYSHAEGALSRATSAGAHAEGYNTRAVGSYSHAEGTTTRTDGVAAHAEGYLTTGSGAYSHAEGYLTWASGSYAHAEGFGAISRGEAAHAEGFSTLAIGSGAHAEGSGSTATSNFSHAEGQRTTAQSTAAHAEGFGSTASGEYSHAEGRNTVASGLGSHAEGNNTDALATDSHAEGLDTRVEVGADYSHTEGYGTQTTALASHAEGWNTSAQGVASHTEGSGSKALGRSSHAEGIQTYTFTTADGAHAEGIFTSASMRYAHAEGYGTRATNTGSHAEGVGTVAAGTYSHAEGYYTTVQTAASYGHAEGELTLVTGQGAHAEGNNTLASGTHAHAEGYYTSASGNHSHAEGNATLASGQGAHAEGYLTTASGNYSHAEGTLSRAQALYSHAGGISTVATNQGQTVVGKFNAHNAVSNSLFVIGNGASDGSRSNLVMASTSSLIVSGTFAVSGSVIINGSTLAGGGYALLVGNNDFTGNQTINGNVVIGNSVLLATASISLGIGIDNQLNSTGSLTSGKDNLNGANYSTTLGIGAYTFPGGVLPNTGVQAQTISSSNASGSIAIGEDAKTYSRNSLAAFNSIAGYSYEVFFPGTGLWQAIWEDAPKSVSLIDSITGATSSFAAVSSRTQGVNTVALASGSTGTGSYFSFAAAGGRVTGRFSVGLAGGIGSGPYATAVGLGVATGTGSFAYAGGNAAGSGSLAAGFLENQAAGKYDVVIGDYSRTTSANDSRYNFLHGNNINYSAGSATHILAKGSSIDFTGANYGILVGNSVSTTGDYNAVFGNGPSALGDGNVVGGASNTITGNYNAVFGQGVNGSSTYGLIVGKDSVPEGGNNIVLLGNANYGRGNYVAALNNKTKAYGTSSLAVNELTFGGLKYFPIAAISASVSASIYVSASIILDPSLGNRVSTLQPYINDMLSGSNQLYLNSTNISGSHGGFRTGKQIFNIQTGSFSGSMSVSFTGGSTVIRVLALTSSFLSASVSGQTLYTSSWGTFLPSSRSVMLSTADGYPHSTFNREASYGTTAAGFLSIADDQFSFAYGNNTRALGDASEAGGFFTTALGDLSIAKGSGSMAFGTGSVAIGQGLRVSGSYQTIVGRFNRNGQSPYQATSSFEVGVGSSDTARHTVFAAGPGGTGVGQVYISGALNIDVPVGAGVTVDGAGGFTSNVPAFNVNGSTVDIAPLASTTIQSDYVEISSLATDTNITAATTLALAGNDITATATDAVTISAGAGGITLTSPTVAIESVSLLPAQNTVPAPGTYPGGSLVSVLNGSIYELWFNTDDPGQGTNGWVKIA